MNLSQLQDQLARVLASAEPRAELERLKEKVDPETRARLEHIQPQGLELSATLILKLRFDRVMRGEPAMAQEYDARPDEFTREFLDYCARNPCRAYFPAEEAAQFQAWRNRSSSSPSAGSSSA